MSGPDIPNWAEVEMLLRIRDHLNRQFKDDPARIRTLLRSPNPHNPAMGSLFGACFDDESPFKAHGLAWTHGAPEGADRETCVDCLEGFVVIERSTGYLCEHHEPRKPRKVRNPR